MDERHIHRLSHGKARYLFSIKNCKCIIQPLQTINKLKCKAFKHHAVSTECAPAFEHAAYSHDI